MSFAADDGWHEVADGTFVALLAPLFQREDGDGVELGLIVGEQMKNLSGAVHGGAIMTLLDRASGMATRAAAGGGRVATASMTVNFLRGVRLGARMVVRARLRKSGAKSFFTDAEAVADGDLVATASGVFLRVGKRVGQDAGA